MTYSQSFNGTIQATGFAAAQEVSSPLVSGASIAAGSVFTQGLTFTENTDGQSYAASGYTGTNPLVEIPAYYNGLPVTTIAANFAQSNTTIKAVTIPNGVEFIGASAFSGCTNLTAVTLPASVTQIGNSAFLASGVTAVTCLATSVPTTGTTVFPTGTAIYVPQSALSAYTSAWGSYGTVAAQTFDGVAAQATNAGTATNATNATNATYAGTATNANNVTGSINGNAINTIFENNGTTVKQATKANFYAHNISFVVDITQMGLVNITIYAVVYTSSATPFTASTLASFITSINLSELNINATGGLGSNGTASLCVVKTVSVSDGNLQANCSFFTVSSDGAPTFGDVSLPVSSFTDTVSAAL